MNTQDGNSGKLETAASWQQRQAEIIGAGVSVAG
jgi:hypothetical protein